ncbi:ATP-binding cassette domain-containing protein, partial [Micromonospora sp. NPDC048843]|uniref:ABC transporter ATP-binding protein C-terminal domain-containing protein n=1 Tax=Micromonospora sp. NPDC048843 TaxID=3155389 RepID=UPI0033C3C382
PPWTTWWPACPTAWTPCSVSAVTGCPVGSGRALAGTLAHGEKRKLEIALLLAGEPRVMLLDEPMAGVSAEDVPELVAVIKSLTGDSGRAVLMVEHHMDVILELADRIAVMHHGALLACDTPETVMANPTVQEAYLGEQL